MPHVLHFSGQQLSAIKGFSLRKSPNTITSYFPTRTGNDSNSAQNLDQFTAVGFVPANQLIKLPQDSQNHFSATPELLPPGVQVERFFRFQTRLEVPLKDTTSNWQIFCWAFSLQGDAGYLAFDRDLQALGKIPKTLAAWGASKMAFP